MNEEPRLADLRALLAAIQQRLTALEQRRAEIEASLLRWRAAEATLLRYARRKGGVI